MKQAKKRANIILFGPPGSGKGTQAKMLEKEFDLLQISTGDLFRYELGNNTPLGQKARTFMDKGQLVPDEVTVAMLKNKLEANSDVRGYIFDGFPRTIPQAEALNQMLKDRDEQVDALILLVVDDDEIVQRLLERGKTSGRSDDASEKVIRDRIQVYQSETSPVFEFYNSLGVSQKISGIGEIDDINARLSGLIRSITH